MNTLIIEPNSKGDYQLFVSLAKRLKVAFREEKTKSRTQKEKDEDFFLLWLVVLTFQKQAMN
jgi:hypothetical protein